MFQKATFMRGNSTVLARAKSAYNYAQNGCTGVYCADNFSYMIPITGTMGTKPYPFQLPSPRHYTTRERLPRALATWTHAQDTEPKAIT